MRCFEEICAEFWEYYFWKAKYWNYLSRKIKSRLMKGKCNGALGGQTIKNRYLPGPMKKKDRNVKDNAEKCREIMDIGRWNFYRKAFKNVTCRLLLIKIFGILKNFLKEFFIWRNLACSKAFMEKQISETAYGSLERDEWYWHSSQNSFMSHLSYWNFEAINVLGGIFWGNWECFEYKADMLRLSN